MNVHLKTLGCRLNEAELEMWAQDFQKAGHQITQELTDAQLIIINSCAVTNDAAKKSRHLIRKLHRENPLAKLVVSGCYATLNTDEVKAILGVDMVIGNQEKSHLVQKILNELSLNSMPMMATEPGETALFEVARHGDVLQMTSTVQGQAKPNTSLFDILNAVFPCGSVTGAPKKRSMEIIQELETEERGYYCGALGWLDPNGDFAFSVPIRTVEIQADALTHASSFTLGVGAGITIDSDAKQEWRECRIKSAFLMNLPSTTGIFETIAIQDAKPQRLATHLNRMQASAFALGITFDQSKAKAMIENACASLDANLLCRLRLDLAPIHRLTFGGVKEHVHCTYSL